MGIARVGRPLSAVLVVSALGAATACSDGADSTTAPTPPAQNSTEPTASPREGTPEGRETDQPARVALSSQQQAKLDRALIEAAWEDDVPRARRLIARGADVNAKDQTVQSAFLIATSEGYLDLLDLTLRNGAAVTSTDSFNGTGLIRAAERGHWQVVGRLLRAGTPVDHVNNLGWTALHEAIILGDGGQRHLDTVRLLVAAGADVQLRSARDGVTPLQHAARAGYAEVAAVVRAGTRVEPRAGANPQADRALLAAARSGDADAAALALRAGARLEARDIGGRTPLLLAVTHDRLAVARLLVALGANPDALDARHDTPWLVTGVTGSVPMAELLLSSEPDLTIRNRFGGTSLIPASERGYVDYVRRMVRTPIEVDHVNDLGWTALLEAVILGDGSVRYQQIVRILLEAGADPSIGDRDGVTPEQHARAKGQDGVARILRAATAS